MRREPAVGPQGPPAHQPGSADARPRRHPAAKRSSAPTTRRQVLKLLTPRAARRLASTLGKADAAWTSCGSSSTTTAELDAVRARGRVSSRSSSARLPEYRSETRGSRGSSWTPSGATSAWSSSSTAAPSTTPTTASRPTATATRMLLALGYILLRFTYRRVKREPFAVIAELIGRAHSGSGWRREPKANPAVPALPPYPALLRDRTAPAASELGVRRPTRNTSIESVVDPGQADDPSANARSQPVSSAPPPRGPARAPPSSGTKGQPWGKSSSNGQVLVGALLPAGAPHRLEQRR